MHVELPFIGQRLRRYYEAKSPRRTHVLHTQSIGAREVEESSFDKRDDSRGHEVTLHVEAEHDHEGEITNLLRNDMNGNVC